MTVPRYFIGIAFVMTANIGLLLFAMYLSKRTGVPSSSFYRDPNVVAQQSFAIGFLSNLGVIGWITAASVALFTCSIERVWDRRHKDLSTLFLLGLLTLLLGADDLFMFHDGLFAHIGISQHLVVLIEALLALGWAISAVRNASSFYRDHLLIILAFACLGTSLILDHANDAGMLDFRGISLLEDAVKLTGISFWTMYTVQFSFKRMIHLRDLRVPG